MHIPGTPESLLARNDSKNPAATCRGLTSHGRPCRRGIAKTPNASPSPHPSPQRRASSPEAFCWQHREQATPCASPSPSRFRPTTIKERTSVDSLVDRLGFLGTEQRKEEQRNNQRRGRKPVPVLDPDVPIPSIEHSPPRPTGHARRRQKKQNNAPLLCCFGDVDEVHRAPRPMKANPGRRTTAPLPPKMRQTIHLKPPQSSRPSMARDPSSKTGEFLALIPATASPQLTAQLLAELAKPFSESDDEGYIYMFWLTSESLPSDAPSETASSLLAPPSRAQAGQRRTSEVLKTFASSSKNPSNTTQTKTMLLKIGRAQNVHRRLNQWTKQCGYNLSLIRYYPYHPTSSSSNVNQAPRTPRKVPNANRIERLIHIELGAKRSLDGGKCAACGREHREWFEVDASREGVKEIDEIIRRWVDWGEKQV